MLQANKTILIYTNDLYAYQKLNINDILEYLQDSGIDPTPNAIEDAAGELIDNDYLYLADLVKNYDKQNNNKIYVKASLGLWRGRVNGWRVYDNLFIALFDNIQDINAVYFESKKTTLTLAASHHDGDNYFKFYKLVNGKKYAIKTEDFLTL